MNTATYDTLFKGQNASLISRLLYPVVKTTFDEMVKPDGSLRPHWAAFLSDLSELPNDTLKARHEKGLRLIQDSGVTYNVYSDQAGIGRPWELDPIPFLISTDEWKEIEGALIQRATLLNYILCDLYREQKLLHNGHLPPSVVFSHPDFWRPLYSAPLTQSMLLTLYAVDLARSPDGRWWIIGDRTAAPSGAGYALENRIITARIHSDIYKHVPVERLAPFFLKMHESLWNLSPHSKDEPPHVALYTPGPYNETYFEHAYLARYLGITLVEGEDLTVRGDHLYLKTLGGLRPVDVLIRRTDDGYCDPLELRSDSSLGIAGLVQAVHAGNVVLANALGTSIVESPALLAFLPGLCRLLLNEDLKMPSVATWWCGQEAELKYVLENLDKLCVRPVVPSLAQPLCGCDLSTLERSELISCIRARPYNYVAQEMVSLSTAPVWSNDQLVPRPVVTRVYLASYKDRYIVMPGGLTRVASTRGLSTVSMQHGGISKDTWILAKNPVEPITLLRPISSVVKPVRGLRDLPSRVADNMFWMGRYLERSEGTTRILRTALVHQVDGSGLRREGEAVPGILAMLEYLPLLSFSKQNSGITYTTIPHQEAVLRHVIRLNFDSNYSVGLYSIISHLQRVAMVVRDRLSLDTWRTIRRLVEEINYIEKISVTDGDLDEVLLHLDQVIQMTEALSGLVMENMTRGLSWRFLDAGRRLERAVHVLDLLTGTISVGAEEDSPALDSTLEISDSIMTYRARYLAPPALIPVADLLLCDESNPRSLAFQLSALQEHMNTISTSNTTAERQIVTTLLEKTQTLDFSLLPIDIVGSTISILCQDLRSQLQTLSEILNSQHFTHAVETSASQANS